MTSEELAKEIEETVHLAQERVTGIGDQQYSTADVQRFEDVPIDKVMQDIEEEALDIISYGVMLRIRVARLRKSYQFFKEAFAE